MLIALPSTNNVLSRMERTICNCFFAPLAFAHTYTPITVLILHKVISTQMFVLISADTNHIRKIIQPRRMLALGIQSHAEVAGESTVAFLRRAVMETIERDEHR